MANPTEDSFDALRLPGQNYSTHTYGVPTGDDLTAPKVFDLMLSYVGARRHGVMLAGGQGVLPTGTVLARKTSDKKYYPYVNGGSGGLQLPVGLLYREQDTGTSAAGTSADCMGNIVVSGEVRYDLAYSGGLDSNAITVLNGRVDLVDVNRFLF